MSGLRADYDGIIGASAFFLFFYLYRMIELSAYLHRDSVRPRLEDEHGIAHRGG